MILGKGLFWLAPVAELVGKQSALVRTCDEEDVWVHYRPGTRRARLERMALPDVLQGRRRRSPGALVLFVCGRQATPFDEV
ncbi:hypothetical protein ATY81_17480 [Rhizobium sp. R72]|nr:hypothetical protein ATY81_17480 [Rhizobium sp. R72]OWW04318.1 hypothetical protein ATY80_17480 [Rhizobium sp. R711]